MVAAVASCGGAGRALASFAAGIVAGAIAGAINGFIVTRVQINALITTLATMAIYRGATQLISGTGIMSIGDDFKAYGQVVFFGLQSPFWVGAGRRAVGWWAVAKTALLPAVLFHRR